jgi:hypothetical protein
LPSKWRRRESNLCSICRGKPQVDQKALQNALQFRSDPQFAKVISAWPKLPKSLKKAVLAILETAK